MRAFTSPLLTHEHRQALIPSRAQQFRDALSFRIEALSTNCYILGEFVVIKLSFHNATNEALTLYTKFSIRPSSSRPDPNFTIFPDISSADGRTIVFGSFLIDIRPPPPSREDFARILPGKTVETVVDFAFPTQMLDDNSYVDIPPGNYFLTLFYMNTVIGPSDWDDPLAQLDWNAWVGETESNQIEICIENP